MIDQDKTIIHAELDKRTVEKYEEIIRKEYSDCDLFDFLSLVLANLEEVVTNTPHMCYPESIDEFEDISYKE